MVTREDIEAFLDRLQTEEATYVRSSPVSGGAPGRGARLDFIVHYNPPVVVRASR